MSHIAERAHAGGRDAGACGDEPRRSTANALLARLARVTTSGRFIPEIDGLRCLAVVAVILTHYVPAELERHAATSNVDRAWVAAYSTGRVGVPLFFAISGFILALPFAEAALAGGRPVRLGRYYSRRVLRIEPPYVVNLTILLGLGMLLRGLARADRLPNYIASLFYVHNIVYDSHSVINFVAWSLEVEAQFYLAAPLLAKVFLMRSKGVRRALLAGSILGLGVLAQASSGLPSWVLALLVFHLHYFLVGFLLADLFVVEWRERPSRSWGWDVAATAAFVAAFALEGGAGSFLIAPAIFAAYAATFRGPLWSRMTSNRWVATTGGMCYTIYLYHYWIFSPFEGVLHRYVPFEAAWPHLLIKTLVFTPMIVAVSAGLFLAFEKPFMRPDWPARLRDRLAGLVRLGSTRRAEASA